MLTSLVERLQRYRAPFVLALYVLPAIVTTFKGKAQTALFAYRLIGITPPSLWFLASRISERISKALDDANQSSLFAIRSIRLSFEANGNFEEWESATHMALDFCDETLGRKAPANITADLIAEALLLVFSPTVHQGLRASPFIDSDGAADRVMSHPCMKILQTQTAGVNSIKQLNKTLGGLTANATTKVLVLTDTDFDFMGPLLERWSADPDINLRSRNLTLEDVDISWWQPKNTIIDRLTQVPPEAPKFLKEDLLWADVVFVEWCQALAARLSGVEIPGKLIIRLHRYEAFIPTPSLTNWNNVDTLLTITPYISKFLERTVPLIENKTKIVLVPNVINLKSFSKPKLPGSCRTLGVIQYSSEIKDPIWALDILEKLQAHDPQWKLQFIGSPFNTTGKSGDPNGYFEQFERRLEPLQQSVNFLGYRDDLDEVLREIGVVLSTSRIEGSPVSLIQGVASGALPVVRNWPNIKKLHAAESLYPREWIVDTTDEAVDRILAWSSTGVSERAEQDPRKWALKAFDDDATFEKIRKVLLE